MIDDRLMKGIISISFRRDQISINIINLAIDSLNHDQWENYGC